MTIHNMIAPELKFTSFLVKILWCDPNRYIDQIKKKNVGFAELDFQISHYNFPLEIFRYFVYSLNNQGDDHCGKSWQLLYQ